MSSGLGHANFILRIRLQPPVIYAARKHYDQTGASGSVNATEHSVMCAGGDDNELQTFRHLMRQLYWASLLHCIRHVGPVEGVDGDTAVALTFVPWPEMKIPSHQTWRPSR
jgi:hypothetical protein